MIIGVKNWNDQDCYFSQTNNAIEKILKSLDCPTKLESCGPTAVTSLISSMGNQVDIKFNNYYPQPEDILTLWFNDSKNFNKMKKCDNSLNPELFCGNEYLAWYPIALKEVFNINSFYYRSASSEDFLSAIHSGRGIVALLKNPSHYISIVAIDTNTKEFVYNDPWPSCPWPKNSGSGFNRRVNFDIMDSNIKQVRLEIL